MILRLSARSAGYRSELDDMPVLLADGTLVDDDSTPVLWPELERGATRAQLVERVRKEFHLDMDGAALNTDRFLSQLRRHGLLVES